MPPVAQAVSDFLARIPKQQLAQAASRCGAHARALQYYESYVRGVQGGGLNPAAFKAGVLYKSSQVGRWGCGCGVWGEGEGDSEGEGEGWGAPPAALKADVLCKGSQVGHCFRVRVAAPDGWSPVRRGGGGLCGYGCGCVYGCGCGCGAAEHPPTS